MIKFPCRCGNQFELPDEEAGGLVQCTKCGLLNDVPLRSDLPHLSEDGTYDIDVVPTAPEPNRLQKLNTIYTPRRTDAAGNEIDLRNTIHDVVASGTGDVIPLAPDDDRPIDRVAPKYDPETGELIVELELKEDGTELVDPASIPMATATINYAAGDLRSSAPSSVFLKLFMPANLFVMFFIFCAHLFAIPLVAIVTAGIFILAPAMLIAVCLVVAHYGDVIEDTGPNLKDELPRPLRDFEFFADIWSPFVGMLGSILICYLPAYFLLDLPVSPVIRLSAIILALGIGTFLLPAVMLTLQTSGSSFNLAPNRVLSVIAGCGVSYIGAILIWVVAIVSYIWGMAGCNTVILDKLGYTLSIPQWVMNWAICFPMLMIGIFFMHYYCWYLGMCYREYHDKFPWILQRHIPTTRNEAALQAAKLAASTGRRFTREERRRIRAPRP